MRSSTRRLSVAAILVVALTLVASGCRRRTPAPGSDEPSPGGEIRLRMWHIMNYEGPREVIADAVKRFEAAHPNVTVEVETFENDAYKQKLSIEAAGGQLPDILFTWGGGGLGELAHAGKVLDLTGELALEGWRDRFMDAPLDFCTVDGKVYAVPIDLACVPLWYNADLFAQHELNPPGTFDDLIKLCGKLRAEGITPVALGNMKQWPGAFYFIYLATRTGGSQLFFDAAGRKPGAKFDDPAFVEAGEKLRQLVDANAFSTGFNGIDVGPARTQFLNEQAAMYLMGTWLVARAIEEEPDFPAKMKCIPFPAVAGGKGDATTVVGGVNCAFAVSRSCENPQKAVALLRFLTDAQVGEAWCRIGRIPALRVSDDALTQLPAPTRAALDLLRAAKTIQPYYDQHLPPRLAEEHKKTTQEIFAGTLTPEKAAERMEKLAGETL